MTDGIAGIQARIAAIEARVGQLRSQPTGSSAPTTSAPAGAATDFASLLQQAQAAQNGTESVDTAKFPNGRIPNNLLSSIGGGHLLVAPAARAFTQLKAAAQQAGVKIGVNDSYRSYDEQVQMAKEKGLYSQGGLAAKPGTSDHGLGIALDLQLDAKAQAWMKQNADKYGFINNVAGESWHWTYKPS